MSRMVAQIVFECATALKVGSNNRDLLQDSPIQRDWNGLPMILGTSLAGVLRKSFPSNIADAMFGKECGSRVIISNALLVDENAKVNEGICLTKSKFLQNFSILPLREHTTLTHKGVTKEHSKFDEEIVYKGTRFKFRIEMPQNDEKDKEFFFDMLDTLNTQTFRIGSGGAKGRGEIKIFEICYDILDDLEYNALSSSLNTTLKHAYQPKDKEHNYIHYKLTLTPDDFFIFGSGGGDEDADYIGLSEKIIDYNAKDLTEKKIVIPASSIKGALSQRTAFYYNQLERCYIEDLKDDKELPNLAVAEIFGTKKDKETESKKGKILLSDVYWEDLRQEDTKVFAHVKIDDFTGGAVNGALFQEKTNTLQNSFVFNVWLQKGIESHALQAFENALKDIAKGALPLGGAVNKGHGFFSGTITKEGENL